MYDATKAVLKGKFIGAYLKKEIRSQIDNESSYFKKLEKRRAK